MSHTEGPWYRNVSAKYPIYSGDPSNHKLIAYIITHGSSGTTPTEQEANYRLIAAAPELLKAVERLLKCPDLNLENMEEETIAATEYAMSVRAKVYQEKDQPHA